MEPPQVIPSTTRLFDAIGVVSKHGYVLVQGTDRTITGIVTEMDLTEQLGQFAGPFLFLGEIERHLRNLIHGKFTLDQLNAASREEKPVEGSSDLTFGELCRLLETPQELGTTWSQDRPGGVHQAPQFRSGKLRNDVVHFNPDGIGDAPAQDPPQRCPFLR